MIRGNSYVLIDSNGRKVGKYKRKPLKHVETSWCCCQWNPTGTGHLLKKWVSWAITKHIAKLPCFLLSKGNVFNTKLSYLYNYKKRCNLCWHAPRLMDTKKWVLSIRLNKAKQMILVFLLMLDIRCHFIEELSLLWSFVNIDTFSTP